jgi:hypothetical protein
MLTFDDLSTAQKKWVYIVNHFHPEVTTEITFKQINDFHDEFMTLREGNKKYKVGLPLWLIGENAVRRGVYFFPSEANTSVPVGTKKAPVKTALLEELKQELKKYGIK